MSTSNPSLAETLQAAQDLMRDRLAAVEAHKENVDAEQEARAALAERERESARTWAVLLDAGWTPAELKKIGFTEPRAKAPGRPRGSRSKAKDSAPGTTPASATPTVPAQVPGTAGSVSPLGAPAASA